MANEEVKATVEKTAKSMGIFVQGLLSESDGTPSSTRLLMLTFAVWTIVVLSCVVHHMVFLIDLQVLTAWLAAFPVISGVLAGLITLPYSVNRGLNTLGSIVSAISSGRTATAAAPSV